MNFGEFKIYPVSDGYFRLDGGAMFGVVPRSMWEKTNPPDDKNRITLGLNTLLVQTQRGNILIDTGIGDKRDAKFNSIFAVEKEPSLADSLALLGLKKTDITIVINTHLHFDHAGGNTVIDGDGVRPAFPNARYIVQRGEWEAANKPNERTQASYKPDDFIPVMEAGLLNLVEGDGEIVKGISVFKAPGHNRDLQLVKIESLGKTALYFSDLVPTTTHLRYPYIAGYDLFPLETLRLKKELITRAALERWLLIFEHDASIRAGYVKLKEGNPEFEALF
ncbi:MAG: MBL fold metallo-hydrolase [Deltaproteobacteria bacterium]|nr:MBL fold metallo-hydrolase [Deltaproteobacteria bacterium]